MSAPLPALSLDDLAAVTGGRHTPHRVHPTPGNAAPVSPEPPVSPDPGLAIGRTASSYRPGSRY
jgi:hypothetical protein